MTNRQSGIAGGITALVLAGVFFGGMALNRHESNKKVRRAYQEYALEKVQLEMEFSAWARTIEGGVCGTPLVMDILDARFDIIDKYNLNDREQEYFSQLAQVDNPLR